MSKFYIHTKLDFDTSGFGLFGLGWCDYTVCWPSCAANSLMVIAFLLLDANPEIQVLCTVAKRTRLVLKKNVKI